MSKTNEPATYPCHACDGDGFTDTPVHCGVCQTCWGSGYAVVTKGDGYVPDWYDIPAPTGEDCERCWGLGGAGAPCEACGGSGVTS